MSSNPNPNLPDRLFKVRQATELKIKPSSYLKDELELKGGVKVPLRLRNYQIQMVYHLLMMKRFVVGDGCGLGKCITGDSLVLTPSGLVPISEMHDYSAMAPDTFDPVQDRQVLVAGKALNVKNFYYGGTKPTVKIQTRYGYGVEGSQVHPMLVLRDQKLHWIPASELQVGDYLCVERRMMQFPKEDVSLLSKSDRTPKVLTPDLSRLMGYYLAIGTLNSHYKVQFTACPEEMPEIHKDLGRLVEPFGGELKSYHSDVSIHDMALREFFLDNGIGYDAKTTSVPPSILKANKECNREFLRGLLSKAIVTKSSSLMISFVSETLCKQAQIMLLRFGIVSERKRKGVAWNLSIFRDEIPLFKTEIGYVNNTLHEEYLATNPKRPKYLHNQIPKINELMLDLYKAIQAAKEEYHRPTAGQVRFGQAFVNFVGSVASGKQVSHTFAESMLTAAEEEGLKDTPEYEALEDVYKDHYFYDPIESLTASTAEVFDIEVDDPSHCFVANGLMNHNTLETIAALCYLWEKEPDLKPVIVTNTSAMRQWGGEFDKFTNGVGWTLVEGTPEKRSGIYEKYFDNWVDGKPEVLITNYHRLRRDKRHFNAAAEGHRYVLILDECFDYHTPITLADGTTEMIGKIVSQKMDVEVMSYNFETGQVEPKRVVNWFKNTKRKTRNKDAYELLKIRFAHGNSVRCTPSHEFYSKNGTKTTAQSLKVGDKVVHYVQNLATNEQIQIVLGGLLGDAGVSHPNRGCPGIVFCQGEAQSEYLNWKRNVLESLGVSNIDIQPSGFKKTSFVHRFRANSHPQITEHLKKSEMHRYGRKRVAAEWLNEIDPLGLAIWYGDDGSLSTYTSQDGSVRYNIMLHTQGFSLEENELLAGWLRWKWEVEAEVKIQGKTREGVLKEYSYLYLPHEAACKFLNLLPGSLPGVEYKFPFHEKYELTHTPLPSVSDDYIVEITKVPMQPKEKYVYDIEVEVNHNYFAGGTLVSNCTAVKSDESQTHSVIKEMSVAAERTYGLTATLIKNNLTEGYGIFKVVQPTLFSSKENFYRDYCVTRSQRLPGRGKRYVKVVVGHTQEHIQKFRTTIEPFYLGRATHTVAKELPVLTAKEIYVPMEYSQWQYYKESLEGLLTLNDGMEDEEERETTKLTSMIYCQQIVDSPKLIGNDVKSGKEEYCMNLLEEEFAGEKVIVFTRFRGMVDRFQELLEAKGFGLGIEQESKNLWNPIVDDTPRFVRITGDEDGAMRDAGRRAFCETDNTNLIFLTMAGAEAINLQQAKIIIFYDLPWSAGDYLQIVGRLIRIGSPHERVYAVHLLGEGPSGEETIDTHVFNTLSKKMGWIEAALGERLVTENEDDLEIVMPSGSDTQDIFDSLVKSARKIK